ncbi:hypothetical protein QZH41_013704, partial [Actinostola sp. cb2023]
VTFIAMDIRSPLIVIPEYGNLKSEGNLLIMDLGHLTVVSDLVNRGHAITKASDDELAKMFYDKFDVMITDVQIIMANKASDWRASQQLDATPDHILPPTGLELQAFKSISAEYPELPQYVISHAHKPFNFFIVSNNIANVTLRNMFFTNISKSNNLIKNYL